MMKTSTLPLFIETSVSLIGFILLFTLLGTVFSPQDNSLPVSSSQRDSQTKVSLLDLLHESSDRFKTTIV